MGPKPSTADQLRDDIDSGRTGDKVDWPDPAAAPLGTDDEAAGRRPTARAIGEMREREVKGAHIAPRHGGSAAAWLFVILILFAAGALLATILIS